MPIVIDDLDVEVEASPPTGAAASRPAHTAELTPGHLVEVAHLLAARHDRVRAD